MVLVREAVVKDSFSDLRLSFPVLGGLGAAVSYLLLCGFCKGNCLFQGLFPFGIKKQFLSELGKALFATLDSFSFFLSSSRPTCV